MHADASRARRPRTHAPPRGARPCAHSDGEFDLDFFCSLLKAARPRAGETFCDLGSGCGRLVFAAALAGYEWREAVGVELLEDLHALATSTLRTLEPIVAHTDEVRLAPCTLLSGDGNELIPQLVRSQGDKPAPWILFAYSTCMPSVGPYLCELSASLGTTLPVGSRVITTDKLLVSDDHGPWRFALRATLDAPNFNTHSSTGYVFELVAKEQAEGNAEHAAATGGGGGGVGRRTPAPGSAMVSRRALMRAGAGVLVAPLALARAARADDGGALPDAGAPRDATRERRTVSFSARSLGLALADVDTADGARVAVSRIVPGSEAERTGVRAGVFLTAIGGEQLAPTVRAEDVRATIARAPRPVALTFAGALGADEAVGLAAKARRAETERFKLERTREPAPNCAIRSRKGDTIEIEYETRLADATQRVIDSSFMRGIGAPFALQLGNGDVPRALELGIYDMCIGEARRIVAPPRLAYGLAGNRALGVPPNATIVFDVTMSAINFQTDPATRREDTGMALTPWE